MSGGSVRALAIAALLAVAFDVGVGAQATVTAIRAGRLFDHETGQMLTNQVIVIEGARIRDVGPSVAIPPGAQVIDLSGITVLRTAAKSGRGFAAAELTNLR